ncbi:MAG: SprB repeat-containing protein, partial [Bacteroidetes bacterium]|nr:SprB repeat-containing protein [Bacteroidota bacterium]
MKTFYMKTTMKFLKLLPALIFFMLALSYTASSQSVYPVPICYGNTIYLECSFLDGGCAQLDATFNWQNQSGSWMSNEKNPIIYVDNPGYATDYFYLSMQTAQGGFSAGRVRVVILPKIIITHVITPVTCFGNSDGKIEITVTGGTPAFTYSWTGPGSYSATTKNISNLAAGTYTVIITDSKGCNNSQLNGPLNTFVVTGPTTPFSVSAAVTDLTCFGVCDGKILTTLSGGTPIFNYVWNDGSTLHDRIGLCGGTYSVSVTDGNNCQATGSWSVIQPTEITVIPTIDSASCNSYPDGSISLAVTGGAGGYLFSWSNFETTQNIYGLNAGDYSVTITDANNCIKNYSYTVGQPDLLLVSGAKSGLACHGVCDGAIALTVSGGTPVYTYLWSTGATTSDINSLCAGTYSVTVIDHHNCFTTGEWSFVEPSQIGISSYTVGSVSCNGYSDGSIDITVTGGIGSYHFIWSNLETTQNITGLVAGTYTVNIVDDNSCTAQSSWTVDEPNELTISGFTLIKPSCKSVDDGAINITVDGGTPPYLFDWDNGATTQNISGLYAGSYQVVITDAHSCSFADGYDLEEPGEISWQGVVDSVTCFGFNDGKITETGVSGGTPPYYYIWSNGATTKDLTGLYAGTYSVTISDYHSCDAFTWRIVPEPALLVVNTIADIVMPKCFG